MDIFFCTQKKKTWQEEEKIVQGQSYVWDFVCELLIVAKYENYIEIISNEVHFFAVDWDLERIWQKAHLKKISFRP